MELNPPKKNTETNRYRNYEKQDDISLLSLMLHSLTWIIFRPRGNSAVMILRVTVIQKHGIF